MTKRTRAVIVVFIALALATHARAITGNEYRSLNDVQRQAWVVGALDGILTTQLMLMNKQPPLVVCLATLEPIQLKAIFERSLEADPERWHFPAAFKLQATLKQYCNLE